MHRIDDVGNTAHSMSAFQLSTDLTRQAFGHGGRP